MNYPDRRMDSDMNHTVRDIVIVPLLPVVNKFCLLLVLLLVFILHIGSKNTSSLPSRQAWIGGAAIF